MAEDTKIQWCDHTWNPWRGCSKVSPGCDHCYAETMSKRNPSVLGVWGKNGTRAIAAESYWKLPLKWNRQAQEAGVRRRVFCASLADVFEDRPELVRPRVRLFHLISETRYLDWLLLTKRPENIERFHGGQGVPRSWSESMPPNIWLGVSVENRKHGLPRIDVLRQTPARVRFLSVEPLLEPLGEINLTGISWVIVGGESGRAARRFHLDWARDILRQCRAANVPCFTKQLGSDPISDSDSDANNSKCEGTRYALNTVLLKDKKGGDLEEFPEDLKVREFPTVEVS